MYSLSNDNKIYIGLCHVIISGFLSSLNRVDVAVATTVAVVVVSKPNSTATKPKIEP